MNQKEDVEKLIHKEEDRLRQLIALADAKVKKLDGEMQKSWDEKENALKELKAKMEEISRPFDKKIESLEKLRNKTSHHKHTLEIMLNTTEFRVKGKLAEDLPEFPDADAFKGFMLSKDIFTHKIEVIQQRLPNGIQLFRHYDDYRGNYKASDAEVVSYFAVNGKKIVAYILTEKSKHPGDTSTVFCWINSQYLRKKYQLSVSDYSHPPTIGFKAWKQMVSELKTFKPIDLDDEKNRNVLSSDSSIRTEDMADGEE